jgi:hypothetical protein
MLLSADVAEQRLEQNAAIETKPGDGAPQATVLHGESRELGVPVGQRARALPSVGAASPGGRVQGWSSSGWNALDHHELRSG